MDLTFLEYQLHAEPGWSSQPVEVPAGHAGLPGVAEGSRAAALPCEEHDDPSSLQR